MNKILMLMAALMLAGCGKKNDCCSGSRPIDSGAKTERFKDLVCGMWVDKTDKAIKAEFDNADYFFCAEECKVEFLKNPTKFASKCNCKTYKRDCKCDHCAGKQVPCDCR